MRRYEESDHPELARWMFARGQEIPDPRALPMLGWIEPGVAAGFLYLTDSSGGLMGGFATNPEATSAVRSAAIDAITKAVLHAADGLGIETLTITTREASLAARAKGHGFQDLGQYTMLVRVVPPKPPRPSQAKEKDRG